MPPLNSYHPEPISVKVWKGTGSVRQSIFGRDSNEIAQDIGASYSLGSTVETPRGNPDKGEFGLVG